MQFNRRRPLHCRVGIQFDTLSGGFGISKRILKECALICARFNTASSARWKRWTGGALCAMRGGARRMNRCAETGYLVYWKAALYLSGASSGFHMCGAMHCPPRRPLRGRGWRAARLKRWACPPCCIRAILTARLRVCWFGGALDLTPYYGFEDDARHFHRTCRDALAPFGDTLYPRFKQACDAYFFLKHRNEPRGIGGIFYDDFSELGFESGCAMMQNVGAAFLDAYLPIIEARRHRPFGARERAFQAYRRGRYVEFNLLFDRGTLFGLQSGGRTESILM